MNNWFWIFLFLPLFSAGQQFRLNVEMKTAAGQKLFLAGYYLENIYVKDSILLDEQGKGVFSSASALPQGLYKIYLDKNKHFDILLGNEQQFSVSNESFSIETLKTEGSAEIAVFRDYMLLLKSFQRKSTQIRNKMDGASASRKKSLEKELSEATLQFNDDLEKLAASVPNTFYAKYIMANQMIPPLDISTLPKEVQNNDTLLHNARFYHQQRHYWDNFDYTDERFLHTPVYKKVLDTWFTKVLYQSYDSVKAPVFQFIEDVKPHAELFRYVVSYFLNNSFSSKVMGMDALFVDIAKKYYLSGQTPWATEEVLEKIRENVLFMENNLIGNRAPDLNLETFDGEYASLHGVRAKYTLLLFYEPNCSYCRVYVPAIYDEIYQTYREKGLEVYAVYSAMKKEEWQDFLIEHGLFGWVNVWDEHHDSRFRILYDVRTTPALFLLDENKAILGKKLTVQQIKDFMEVHLN